MTWLTPIMALGLSLVAGTVMFYLLGFPPFESLHAFFINPINNLYGISELFVKATPAGHHCGWAVNGISSERLEHRC